MSKKRMGSPRIKQKLRKKPPLMRPDGKDFSIYCPFCTTPHPIDAQKASHCGTMLEIMAVQPTFKMKEVMCLMCGKPGGTLIKVGDQYAHDYDCSPDKTLFAEQPKLSKMAHFVYEMPVGVQNFIKKWFKKTANVVGHLEKGQIVDVIGYTWQRTN